MPIRSHACLSASAPAAYACVGGACCGAGNADSVQNEGSWPRCRAGTGRTCRCSAVNNPCLQHDQPFRFPLHVPGMHCRRLSEHRRRISSTRGESLCSLGLLFLCFSGGIIVIYCIYCIIVLQCYDTVGLVMRPVKLSPK